jgi:hypothetical protein
MCINAHNTREIAKNDALTIWYTRFMLTTEIQQGTHSGPVTLNPRWLRIPAAVKYSGLSRSRLYELLSEGKIRSICVKSHKGAERGVRLLDRESIDAFMLAFQTEVVSQEWRNWEGDPRQLDGHMRRCSLVRES